ncbi:MAG: TolC family protein [Deltaproteobacteria bacterium]|jgi:outer membrane protein TolC|nr:TolC family protein [Deltaproteobacteria bacterium]
MKIARWTLFIFIIGGSVSSQAYSIETQSIQDKINKTIHLADETARDNHSELIGELPPLSTNQTSKYTFTLDDCINFALRNNNNIKIAKKNIVKQNAIQKVALSQLLPSLTLNTSATKIDDEMLKKISGTNGRVTENLWDADATINQTLFAGGKNLALLQKENLMLDSLKKKLKWIVEDTIFNIKTIFYSALLARNRIEVQEQLVELLSKELISEKNKFKAGVVPEFNVLRAEVALANSKVPLIRAQNSYRITIEELRQVLGLSDIETESQILLDIKGELKDKPYNINLDKALEIAQSNRAELEELYAAIAAQDKVILANRAGYLPKINIFASYGLANKNLSHTFYDDAAAGWKVGALASWNLFDGFGTTAQVEQAIADKNILKTNKSNQQLTIEVEVRRAYSSFVEAKALLEASTKVTEQAEESLRLAKASKDAGVGIQLDVLQSQYDLTDACNNKISALYDYNVAIARLERAVGK